MWVARHRSPCWRAGRPEDQLKHPDQKSVATDNADRDDRPDPECQRKERDELAAAEGPTRPRICRSGLALGHEPHLTPTDLDASPRTLAANAKRKANLIPEDFK
jgi:hypothetical protein